MEFSFVLWYIVIGDDIHGNRPTYFTIKDKDILWFIPISSKVDKYQKIIDKKNREIWILQYDYY